MFARVTSLAAGDVAWDALASTVATGAGFAGMTLSRNAAHDRLTMLTIWSDQTAANRDEFTDVPPSARPVHAVAPKVLVQMAIDVPDDSYDLRGAVHRLVRVRMDPSDVATQAEYFRARVIPENLLLAEGFCGVRLLVDAVTGAGLVSTVWRDAAATLAVDALGSGRRQRGLTRGIEIGEPTYEEIVRHSWGPLA